MGLLDPKKVSTQDHLDIEDIRDDLVVLKNGKVSLVLETTSLNFDLLADREQDTRIYTFAGLLNSLKFPIQIVIRTQQTDVSKYMGLLDSYRQKVGGSPLQQQVQIYQDFISKLTSNTQILNKRFYAIIPTITSVPVVKSNPIKTIFGVSERIVNVKDLVEKAKIELAPKRDHLIKQFDGMGLLAQQLKNEELIKLYYSIYEPDKSGLEVMHVRENEITGAVVNTSLVDEITQDQSPQQQ